MTKLNNSGIKRLKKIVVRTILGLLLFLLLSGIALTLPPVQSKLGDLLTRRLNKDFGTDMQVERVALTVFGGVKLRNVLIRDHHKDTLIFGHRIQTNILSFKQLYNGDLLFGDIRGEGLYFNLKTYKGERDTNLDWFLQRFETDRPASGRKFLMQASKLYVTSSRFSVSNLNRPNPKELDLRKVTGRIEAFQVHGPEVRMNIKSLAALDHRGLYVQNLTGAFKYDKSSMELKNLSIETQNSTMKGEVVLQYRREDFADFNNKVRFDIRVDEASLSTNDIHHFYAELGRDLQFNLKARVRGTLNDLTANGLVLRQSNRSEIIGDVQFKNLFGKDQQRFYMMGDFNRVASDYSALTKLLPNVLGEKLPPALEKLGLFSLSGTVELSESAIQANVAMQTQLGNLKSDLVMTDIDNIDAALYTGNIIMDKFDLGRFLDQPEVGRVSLDLDVDGKGFSSDFLDTSFSGDIYSLRFRDYTYTNILVHGDLKHPVFEGKVYVNDPNLFMDFEGRVNLRRKHIDYDFHAIIDYANLEKMKWVKRDSVSVFKGDIRVDVTGNSFDDLAGDIYIARTSYQNSKETFYFDDFAITSRFDAQDVRTISVNSPDILSGSVVGKYKVAELWPMIENSMGSIYANYRPNKVSPGQFLRFNFEIQNKIIALFMPEVSIGPDTHLRGRFSSDDNEFRLRFNSPEMLAFKNKFENVRLLIDNKNPLYNAFVEVDTIHTPVYKMAGFSAINLTARDSLFTRVEFKGGPKSADHYNLNLFHTVDKSGDIVLGFNQSELFFKNRLWHLNPASDRRNKITVDRDFRNFIIDNIILAHEEQQIQFVGKMSGEDSKDVVLNFDNVNLDHVLPELEGIALEGILNGQVQLRQHMSRYQPRATIRVNQLNVNDIAMGDLSLDAFGNEDFSEFQVNSRLWNENVESFRADGVFSIENKQTHMDLDLAFEEFNLSMLNGLLAGDAISDIKGFVSGHCNLRGLLNDPEVNGRLFADHASLRIPYLNVAYELDRRSVVDVTQTQFLIRPTSISDLKFHTAGYLQGSISHQKFKDWALDLTINSPRLLALDTRDSEDAAYYGTAFINGQATVYGPTDALFIKVSARSESGTSIKIPINSDEAAARSNYIHYLSPDEKYNLQQGITLAPRNYNGLELEMDFDITPEADIEVILDRSNGHGMKGKGFGSLLFKINTLGTVNMWGDFQAYEGTYNFKYGGLIDKKLRLKRGGSIIWEGDPMRAVLNLEAVYTTTANPAILLENPSVNKKVPVEVIVGVRGNLTNPEPDFNINFPTVSSVLKSEIQYKLDDKDTRQKQALYLLSSGTFLSAQGVSESDFAGNLFETASGLFSDILQDPDSQIKVGFDYVAADKRPGTETDGRVGVTVSTQVNDRITINGKLGVPVGGINESAVVGDVEIQYRVNEDGTMNLRVFNRENDINYIGQGIGYTQGVGITYEVDFNTFRELIHKIFRNVRLDTTPGIDLIPDSTIVPEGFQFTSPDEKPSDTSTDKPNREAVPSRED